MYFLLNMRTATRLALGFGVVLLCAAAMLGLGLWNAAVLYGANDHLANVKLAGLADAVDMRDAANGVALALRKVATPADGQEAEREAAHLDQLLADYDRSAHHLSGLLTGSGEAAALEQATAARQALGPIVEKSKTLLSGSNYMAGAMLVQHDFLPAHAAWLQALDQLTRQQRAESLATAQQANTDYRRMRAGMAAIGAATLALAVAFAIAITRRVTRPLQRACETAARIATGDFSAPCEAGGKDEAAQLMQALDTMRIRLSSTLATIRLGLDTMAHASREIATGNASLSERTEQQANGLARTTAAMQALTGTVRANADNAALARGSIDAASGSAAHGRTVVTRMADTMESIQRSSGCIVNIIAVIDSIAFQTNILALNAAVEAARAGQQGRGFAIVAGEVRSLAHRSAAAAREIKALIEASTRDVGAGAALAGQAGQAMQDIEKAIADVVLIVQKIDAASVRQNDGIGQVNTAVTHMNDITRKNAALAEQAATTAASMQSEAAQLAQSAAVFRLAEGDATGVARPVPAADAGMVPALSAPSRQPQGACV